MKFCFFLVLALLCVVPNSMRGTSTDCEIRAVWLTTNWGLDWPQEAKGVDAQKQKLCSILDNLKRLKFNTILFQVRSQGRVFYRSALEPLSPYFCHDKNFDPLAFAVQECHKRGMECHAWIMVYSMEKAQYKTTIIKKLVRRNKSTLRYKSVSVRNVINNKPSYYKLVDGIWYLNPGCPETNERIISIVKEIVGKYDIDGIHLDHIRYPSNNGFFPDADTYRQYGKGLDLTNWRRHNINHLVTSLYDTIKAMKPWVQVSSALIGKYKPNLNFPRDGWTAFGTVYQDGAYWIKEGKQDLLFPMMYYRAPFFEAYTKDWSKLSAGRLIVPGLALYKMDKLEKNWNVSDITNEIHFVRKINMSGEAYFRTAELLENMKHIKDSIHSYYDYLVKLPPLKWLNKVAPDSPCNLQVSMVNGYKQQLHLHWDVPKDIANVTYNVYVSPMDNVNVLDTRYLIATGIHCNDIFVDRKVSNYGMYYTVTASDRYHNESVPCISVYFSHALNEE